MSPRAPGMAGAGVGVALAAVLAVLAPTAPATAAGDVACDSLSAGSGEVTQLPAATSASKPLDEMGVPAAQQFLTTSAHQTQPGAGVVVAVLDSGVAAASGIPVAGTVMAGAKQAAPTYYHGTDTAGLIAGPARADGQPVGVAPGAQILDVRVYDDPGAASDATDAAPITSADVLAGLQQVLALVGQGQLAIKVVAVPLEIQAADGLQQVIDQLWDAGVVVVASAGNRPQADASNGPLPSAYATADPGEDAATAVYPAHYDHVLAVGSSMTGYAGDEAAQTFLLQNSDTDVATPTAAGVSYSVVGGTCVNAAPATSWSTAYVAGVLALDQSYYDESPARAVSRLENTANGRVDIPNDLVGAGEVQPVAALTRPLRMDAAGRVLDAPVARSEPQVVRAPTTPPDVLASTRRNAVWWGLGGGGALLLALLLRPVLARRRGAAVR